MNNMTFSEEAHSGLRSLGFGDGAGVGRILVSDIIL